MVTYQLRAMSFGEILDGAFSIYRRHFGVLIGVAVICTGIPTILNVYMGTVGMEFVSLFTWLLWLLLYGVGGLVAAGATIWIISEAYLGIDPTIGDALGFAMGKWWKIFFAGAAKYFIIGLALGGPTILGGAVGAVLNNIVGGLVLAVGMLAGMVVAVIVTCGYAVVTQAAVLEEDTSATDALGRSWSLTKGFKAKAFGLGFVIVILVSVPVMAAGVLAALIPPLAALINGLGGLAQLLMYPVWACAFTLLYYDLRVRNEAFDIKYLSEQLRVDSPNE